MAYYKSRTKPNIPDAPRTSTFDLSALRNLTAGLLEKSFKEDAKEAVENSIDAVRDYAMKHEGQLPRISKDQKDKTGFSEAEALILDINTKRLDNQMTDLEATFFSPFDESNNYGADLSPEQHTQMYEDFIRQGEVIQSEATFPELEFVVSERMRGNSVKLLQAIGRAQDKRKEIDEGTQTTGRLLRTSFLANPADATQAVNDLHVSMSLGGKWATEGQKHFDSFVENSLKPENVRRRYKAALVKHEGNKKKAQQVIQKEVMEAQQRFDEGGVNNPVYARDYLTALGLVVVNHQKDEVSIPDAYNEGQVIRMKFAPKGIANNPLFSQAIDKLIIKTKVKFKNNLDALRKQGYEFDYDKQLSNGYTDIETALETLKAEATTAESAARELEKLNKQGMERKIRSRRDEIQERYDLLGHGDSRYPLFYSEEEAKEFMGMEGFDSLPKDLRDYVLMSFYYGKPEMEKNISQLFISNLENNPGINSQELARAVMNDMGVKETDRAELFKIFQERAGKLITDEAERPVEAAMNRKGFTATKFTHIQKEKNETYSEYYARVGEELNLFLQGKPEEEAPFGTIPGVPPEMALRRLAVGDDRNALMPDEVSAFQGILSNIDPLSDGAKTIRYLLGNFGGDPNAIYDFVDPTREDRAAPSPMLIKWVRNRLKNNYHTLNNQTIEYYTQLVASDMANEDELFNTSSGELTQRGTTPFRKSMDGLQGVNGNRVNGKRVGKTLIPAQLTNYRYDNDGNLITGTNYVFMSEEHSFGFAIRNLGEFSYRTPDGMVVIPKDNELLETLRNVVEENMEVGESLENIIETDGRINADGRINFTMFIREGHTRRQVTFTGEDGKEYPIIIKIPNKVGL